MHVVASESVCPHSIRVAFAGTRKSMPATFHEALGHAFQLVVSAAHSASAMPVSAAESETIGAAHASIWHGCEASTRLTLLASYAVGADRAAVRLWSERSYGSIHAIFPFADPANADSWAWTDDPSGGGSDLRVEIPKPRDLERAFDAVTVIDGEACREEVPARAPHLEQCRWLVDWADVVIVAWDGQRSAGPGGTADTVALALTRALPIIWIDIASEGFPVRLLSPERLWPDFYFPELVEALADSSQRAALARVATIEECAALLASSFRPPRSDTGHAGDNEETSTRRDYAAGDPLKVPAWKEGYSFPSHSFRLLRARMASGLAEAWTRFFRSLATVEDEVKWDGSATKVTTVSPQTASSTGYRLICEAFLEADQRATLLGNLHRAVQLALLLLAVAAVAIGTLPAIWNQFKFPAVFVELLLVVSAFLVWRISFIATNHRRWSDTRRLAERLRALKATWPLGFDVNDSDHQLRTWTEWQARAIRRAAGPPSGLLSAARRDADAAAARDDPAGLVAGQARHHARTAERMERFHNLLRSIENGAFWTLAGTLALFLLLYGILHEFPKVGGLVLMFSAVIPTIAAACLAIEAKIGLEENSRRSARFAREFEQLLDAMNRSNSVVKNEKLLRDAARLHISDVDNWREAAVQRRIATI